MKEILFQNSGMRARFWGYSAYLNPLLCSKYFLAEELFAKVNWPKNTEGLEIVSASVGNLAVSLAFLAIKHRVRATLFVPRQLPRKTMDLLGTLNANVVHIDTDKLYEEVRPKAIEYAAENPQRIYLDQFDVKICGQTYLKHIFDNIRGFLPLKGEERELVLFVPMGTGSLLYAAMDFLVGLNESQHELYPVVYHLSGKEPELDQSTAFSHDKSKLILHKPQTYNIGLGLDCFYDYAHLFDIPFGVVSSGTMSVAMDIMNQRKGEEKDFIAIFTDAFLTSPFMELVEVKED